MLSTALHHLRAETLMMKRVKNSERIWPGDADALCPGGTKEISRWWSEARTTGSTINRMTTAPAGAVEHRRWKFPSAPAGALDLLSARSGGSRSLRSLHHRLISDVPSGHKAPATSARFKENRFRLREVPSSTSPSSAACGFHAERIQSSRVRRAAIHSRERSAPPAADSANRAVWSPSPRRGMRPAARLVQQRSCSDSYFRRTGWASGSNDCCARLAFPNRALNTPHFPFSKPATP